MNNARPPIGQGTGAVDVLPGGQLHGTGSQGHELAVHAAAYARAGLRVLPLHWPTPTGCSCARGDCPSPAKHPLVPHGKDDATTNVKTIGSWWAIWPQANIGVRPADGVAVLDIDPRAGGAVRLVELLAACGVQLLPTLTANTGGGGIHAWYRCPGPHLGRVCTGVDIKTSTGYLVMPPSAHASGGHYTWATRREVAVAPSWLRKLIRRPPLAAPARPVAAGGSAEDGLVRTVATAAEGAATGRCTGPPAAPPNGEHRRPSSSGSATPPGPWAWTTARSNARCGPR